MRKIEATYYVATPLFLGGAENNNKAKGRPQAGRDSKKKWGADNTVKAELRPPSLKGLLRFWFRASAWPQLRSIENVWKEERSLFGSTKSQGKFLLSVTERKGLDEGGSGEEWKRSGLAYLGYGPVEKGKTTRPYLRHGGQFTVELILARDVSDQQVDFLIKSLKALGLFGGAGARSRKGLGSLSLVSLLLDGKKIWSAPVSFQELKEKIKDYLASLGLEGASAEAAALPPYTAFSPKAKVYLKEGGRDPLDLLDNIGKEMLRYRSYGLKMGDRHVLFSREPAEQNFADDHDLILKFLQGSTIDLPPRRVVFGLPHNYYFKSTKQSVTVEPEGIADKRRASPLFIHIHALSSGQYGAVLALMPAVFLPEGKNIMVSGKGQRQTVPAVVDFNVIETFLHRPGVSAKVVWP